MHNDNDAAHQRNVIADAVHLIDAHFGQKYFRVLEMAVHGRFGTWKKLPIHAVNGVDDAMETGTEITDVPHPTKHWRNVLIARTKTKHGEQYGQNWSDEDGNLQLKE